MQRPVRSFAAVTGQTRPIKVMINIGACLDIITGRYIIGSHGEHILNGGLANLTGIAGRGNSFKSTIMHYMMLSAQGRMYSSFCGTYDTEMNIQEWHLKEMALSVRRALDVPAVSEDDELNYALDYTVQSGDTVKAGQPIGLTGRTGRATTEHVHFETRINGQHFNPNLIFNLKEGTLRKECIKCTKNGNGVVVKPQANNNRVAQNKK